MKKNLLLLSLILIVFSSAIPPQSGDKGLNNAQFSIPENYTDAKTALENFKGEKLSVKEKLALKYATNKLSKQESSSGGKSQLVALLLCIFVGAIGIHRFYLGYTTAGVIQLLTAGGCGIWALIDLIRIITGDLKPKNGDYEKTL